MTPLHALWIPDQVRDDEGGAVKKASGCMRPAPSPAPAFRRAGMGDGGRGRDREPVGVVRCMDRPTGLPRHDDFTAVQTLWRSGFPPACRIVSRTLPGRLRGVSTGSKAGQRGSPADLHASSILRGGIWNAALSDRTAPPAALSSARDVRPRELEASPPPPHTSDAPEGAPVSHGEVKAVWSEMRGGG